MSEDNIHAGHRQRLLETAYKCGLENLDNIQAMEYILFYIFPRGDVNPLAHRLLARFKTISSVLDASIQDLAMVEGMGEASAKKLHNLVNIFNLYTQDKAFTGKQPSTLGEIYDYIEGTLRFKETEEMVLLGISPNGRMVASRTIGRGNIENVVIDMNEVALFIATTKVPAVIFVHNHPKGSCLPSNRDTYNNSQLEGLFAFAGCKLIDNLTIGVDGIYSLKDNVKRRSFAEDKDTISKTIQKLRNL